MQTLNKLGINNINNMYYMSVCLGVFVCVYTRECANINYYNIEFYKHDKE